MRAGRVPTRRRVSPCAWRQRSRYLESVPTLRDDDVRPGDLVFDGGPLDGMTWPDMDAQELNVVMSDGQRHRYVTAGDVRRLPDGRLANVFAWTGRYFGAD